MGKLVRDDAAYRQLMSLAARGERAVVTLDDNLMAFKGMWPMSGYFKDRGYEDPDRVLYRPNSTRDERMYPTETLFGEGTAILSPEGKTHLDSLAQWFKARKWPETTEVVIASFSDSGKDADATRILTQDQAIAVKTYLEQKHRLFDLALFRQRKVAAVGFGDKRPKVAHEDDPNDAQDPPRHIEIVFFTPKS